MYDDFTELRTGAAKEYEARLYQSVRDRPIADQAAAGSQPSMASLQLERGRSPGYHSTSAQLPLQHLSNVYDPCPQERREGSTVVQCDPECRWLLVCARTQKGPTKLSHMNICSTFSDKELFRLLNKSYCSIRSSWKSLLSLRKVQSIRFVHVRELGLRSLYLCSIILTYIHSFSSVSKISLTFVNFLICLPKTRGTSTSSNPAT